MAYDYGYFNNMGNFYALSEVAIVISHRLSLLSAYYFYSKPCHSSVASKSISLHWVRMAGQLETR